MRRSKEHHVRDKQFNIKRLLLQVLKGWRSVLVCVIVSATVVILGNHFVQRSQTDVTETVEIAIQDRYDSLETDEKEQLDYYFVLNSNLKEQREYLKSSALMDLDPNNVYKIVTQYNILLPDNEGENEYLIDTLYNVYTQYIGSDVFLDNEKLNEIEIFENVGDVNQLIAKVEESVPSGIEQRGRAIFSIVVRFANKAGGEELSRQVDEQIQKTNKVLQELVGEHEVKMINEMSKRGGDSELADVKNAKQISVLTSENQINNLKKELTGEQLDILNNWDRDEVKDVPEKEVSVVMFKVQHLVMGSLLGMVFAVMLATFRYIFAANLNYAKEMEEIFGIEILGVLKKKSNRGSFVRIDDIINNRLILNDGNMTNEEKINYLCTDLKLKCRKESINEIGMASTGVTIQDKDVITKIKEKLQEANIRVVEIGRMDKEEEALEKTVEVKNIVLLEIIEESSYKLIEKQINICNEFQVNILGAIVLQ